MLAGTLGGGEDVRATAVRVLTGEMLHAQPPLADGPLDNAEALRGRIAVVRRGGCSFAAKAERCVEAGALAVVVVNSEQRAPAAPAAVGDISVPVVMIEGPAQQLLGVEPGVRWEATLRFSRDWSKVVRLVVGAGCTDVCLGAEVAAVFRVHDPTVCMLRTPTTVSCCALRGETLVYGSGHGASAGELTVCSVQRLRKLQAQRAVEAGGHRGAVVCCCCCERRRCALTGGRDNRLCVWAEGGALLLSVNVAEVEPPCSLLTACAINEAGDTLIAVLADGATTWWGVDLSQPAPRALLLKRATLRLNRQCNVGGLSMAGRWLATVEGDTAVVWDAHACNTLDDWATRVDGSAGVPADVVERLVRWLGQHGHLALAEQLFGARYFWCDAGLRFSDENLSQNGSENNKLVMFGSLNIGIWDFVFKARLRS